MRIRTAKTQGTRYDLNYFKRLTTFRRWRFGLCIALAVIALFWLGASHAMKKTAIYSAGPLSSAHAFIANRCELCHAKTGGFLQSASDIACLTCHEAPEHQKNQMSSAVPSCASCHVEHQGLARLAHVQDRQCVACHSDLNLKIDPKSKSEHPPSFETKITGFHEERHPEFLALRAEFHNPATITFSHAAHLNLKDPQGQLLDLPCSECHRPVTETGNPWKYSIPNLKLAATGLKSAQTPYPDSGRALMTMPKYEQSCATGPCHDLTFSAKLDAVDHPKSQKEVAALPALIQERIADYIRRNGHGPEDLYSSNLKIPEKPQDSGPSNDTERLALFIANGGKRLWKERCQLCHQLDFPSSEEHGNIMQIPVVKESGLAPRFMPHAIFSHQAHSAVQCESCHVPPLSPPVPRNHDIRMPGIKTCVQCHNGNPARAGQAENGCFLCHEYHNWDPSRKMFRSKHTIQELTGWTPPSPGGTKEASAGK